MEVERYYYAVASFMRKDGMMFDSPKSSKLYVSLIGFVFTFGIAVIQVCISL